MKPVRKAVETLAVVLFIFFILACRCQSDLLDFGKSRRTPPPPPPPPTPSSTPYQAPANLFSTPTPSPAGNRNAGSTTTSSRLSTGTYTGSGLNTTYNQRGDFLIRVDSVEANGSVKGYFEASNGLAGNGPLFGSVDGAGKVTFIGKMSDGQGLIVSAVVSGDTMKGTYVIGNKQQGVQKGEFTVTRR